MSRHQSRCPWSRRPLMCSSRSRFSVSGRSCPRLRARSSRSSSAVSGRSSLRSQREIGTPKPAFRRLAIRAGSVVGERLAQGDLAAPRRRLELVRQGEPELDHAVVEERRAQLERGRHRGDVRLVQQVAREVGLDVEELQARDAGARAARRGATPPTAGHRARRAPRPTTAARADRRGRSPSAARSARRQASRRGSRRRAARAAVERGSRRALRVAPAARAPAPARARGTRSTSAPAA